MASVDGLAPSTFGLKGRTLELLCIHGPKLEMVPEVGSAPTSPRLQRGANLSQLLGGEFFEIALLRSVGALRSHRAPRCV